MDANVLALAVLVKHPWKWSADCCTQLRLLEERLELKAAGRLSSH